MQSSEFCTFDSEQSPGVYVDLLANPEGYTGYIGESARRIWDSIYSSGCGEASDSDIFGVEGMQRKQVILSTHLWSARLDFNSHCKQILQQAHWSLGGEY